jgi:kynurenine formamidase
MHSRKLTAAAAAVAVFGVAGVAGATMGVSIRGGGTGGGRAELACPGGMSRLGQVFSEAASVFPGDPNPVIDIVATVEDDGFLVEQITTGVHTGTHLDAPGHFILNGRTVDALAAEDFVWPAYVIDVRERMADPSTADDFQLSIADIRAAERRQGRIPHGAMVIINTGFGELFGTDAYFGDTPGFSGDAVQWMVDHRGIGGVGSDTFGPDASSDIDFAATFTILDNDRVALPGLANLDSLHPNGDIIIASALALQDGSGFMTDPLACHRR